MIKKRTKLTVTKRKRQKKNQRKNSKRSIGLNYKH